MEKLETYLKENPFVCPSDISFLCMNVFEHNSIVEQASNSNQRNNILSLIDSGQPLKAAA